MKPNIRTLEKLEALDSKIKELYKKKREVIGEMVKKYGEGEFVYELETPNEEGQKFVRYKLVDNLSAFETGEPMFKASSFERYGFEFRYLKNMPKEKVES